MKKPKLNPKAISLFKNMSGIKETPTDVHLEQENKKTKAEKKAIKKSQTISRSTKKSRGSSRGG